MFDFQTALGACPSPIDVKLTHLHGDDKGAEWQDLRLCHSSSHTSDPFHHSCHPSHCSTTFPCKKSPPGPSLAPHARSLDSSSSNKFNIRSSAYISSLVTPAVLTYGSTSTISLSGVGFAAGDSVKAVPSQLEVAGDLYVNVDCTCLPVSGSVTGLVNMGTLGGTFVATNNPSITALGPLSTTGITFDGSSNYVKLNVNTPESITATGPSTIEVWVYNPSVTYDGAMLAWGTRVSTGDQMIFYYGTSTSGAGPCVHSVSSPLFSFSYLLLL